MGDDPDIYRTSVSLLEPLRHGAPKHRAPKSGAGLYHSGLHYSGLHHMTLVFIVPPGGSTVAR
jgi:hypothetical protein